MRINREEKIVIDELERSEVDSELFPQGVLSLTDECDETNLIYVTVGTKQLGFISKEDLVRVAEKIIELWKEKVVGERKNMNKRDKALLFVEHIENHIKNGDDVRVPRNAKVLCKFCDKTIDQIVKEAEKHE